MSINTPVTMIETKCPSSRDAAEATPLSNPMTSAGQHQAPIRAGMESKRMIMDITNPRLSVGSEFSTSFVVLGRRGSCSFLVGRSHVVQSSTSFGGG